MFVFKTWIDLCWEMNRLSSTKERKEIGILRFFKCFSRMWKIGERYKADKMGERAKPCLTPILILQKGEEKLFYKYFVFLPIR